MISSSSFSPSWTSSKTCSGSHSAVFIGATVTISVSVGVLFVGIMVEYSNSLTLAVSFVFAFGVGSIHQNIILLRFEFRYGGIHKDYILIRHRAIHRCNGGSVHRLIWQCVSGIGVAIVVVVIIDVSASSTPTGDRARTSSTRSFTAIRNDFHFFRPFSGF